MSMRPGISSARRGREGGFALLLVLWSLALLALLISQLASTARTELQLTSNLRSAATLEAQVEGVVQEVAFHLLDRSATGWIADGRIYRLQLEGGAANVQAFDEGGKVNPNTATPDLLRALLRALGVDGARAEKVAQAIADWRTPFQDDAQAEARLAVYRQSSRNYGPAGLPFIALDELLLVPGVTDDLLARLRPHLSVFTQGNPDPVLADTVVRGALQSIGISVERRPRPPADMRVIAILVTAAAHGAKMSRRVTARISTGSAGLRVAIQAWDS